MILMNRKAIVTINAPMIHCVTNITTSTNLSCYFREGDPLMLPDSMDTLTLSIYWRGEDTSPSTGTAAITNHELYRSTKIIYYVY